MINSERLELSPFSSGASPLCHFCLQRLRQQMEEIYSDNPVRSASVPDLSWSSKTGKFLSQGSHQHQRSLLPLLSSSTNSMPHSQSRYCKEFMEDKFEEVWLFTFYLNSTQDTVNLISADISAQGTHL